MKTPSASLEFGTKVLRYLTLLAVASLLIGLLFVLINLVVDLLYFAVDPRLRAEGGGARVAGH